MRDRAERPKRARRAPGATEQSGRSEGAERPERGSEALGASEASVPQALYIEALPVQNPLRCAASSPLKEFSTPAALRSAASPPLH